jgi:hypothetical protein
MVRRVIIEFMVNRIAISITTNDSPDVIQSVIKNFSAASAQLHIFLHISKNSKYPLGDFIELENQFLNLVVNRRSAFTVWGNLFQGHLENLHLIASDQSFSHFAFSATNDLFVRNISSDYFERFRVGYFNNMLTPGHSWFSASDVNHDSRLRKLNSYFGFENGVQSQVEGSFYPIDFLSEALKLMDKFDLKPHDRYPVEEIYLPTIARNLGFLPETEPYIFSEVQRYDQFKHLIHEMKMDLGSAMLLNIFARVYQEYGKFEISKIDVDEIIENSIPPLFRGVILKRIFESQTTSREIFGVKRVPRELDNELRIYIESSFQ